MSAPKTNIEKQERRHFGPLLGMAAGIAFLVVIVIAFLIFTASPDEDPSPEAITSDGAESAPEGTPTETLQEQN